MGRQGPAKRLVVKRPSSSLISLANVIPLLLQVLSCVAVQIGALIFLHDQDWFYNTSLLEMSPNCQANTTNYTTEASGFVENILCWENTVLFLVSCFQYLILGAVYSKGFPHRQPLYTNCKLHETPLKPSKPNSDGTVVLMTRYADHIRGRMVCDDIVYASTASGLLSQCVRNNAIQSGCEASQ